MEMEKLKLSEIRIDGGTQMRASINMDLVKEYAEAFRNGAQFEPVVVFFDGVHYWLADGFHRYHATEAAKIMTLYCEVRFGSLREAILYALKANNKHGLRRSNEDKRICVQTMLDDAEWCLWSNVKIAISCEVSDTFVAAVRSPEAKAKQAEKIKRHFEKKSTSVKPTPTEETETSVKPSLAQDFGPSEEEIRASERAQSEFLELMQEAFEADDILEETAKLLKQSLLELHHLKITNNGLVNTNTELTKMVKSLQRQLDKAKK
jgi:hypothetical protein